MADIKLKPIDDLTQWNAKELRKLRMTINNRLSAFETSQNPKNLPDNHPLHNLEAGECKELLAKVLKAEKNL